MCGDVSNLSGYPADVSDSDRTAGYRPVVDPVC